jgi:monofunctional biosynthetic peptidoglycan transglycosylase
MKKIIIISSIFCSIFITITILFYLFSLSPHIEKIDFLKKGYYLINSADDVVTYKYIKYRPSNWTKPSISNKALRAIIISEDWDYFNHSGVDYEQIKKALEDKIILNKKWRGASTITQQLVKNLFLSPQKTIIRKIKEAILALYMNHRLSKMRILELYINIIQYGDNLYGVSNASNYYFNKDFNKLSPKEGAFLAMLLPNPKKYSHSFQIKKLTPYAEKTINSILMKLLTIKVISEDELLLAQWQTFNWEINE